MEETEDLAQTEEENNDAVLEPSESWADDPPQEAESHVPDILSSPATAPSVTPSRKNELLLQARADRIAWIQRVPLPYKTFPSASTDDPWSQDDRLALVRDSNAVQSLPSIPNVLSSLYGIEESTPVHVIATRIQALLEPLGLTQEDRDLAMESCKKQSLLSELANADNEHQRQMLETYHSLLTKLKMAECATMVQGMRTFVRTLPETEEVMASSLRSFLASTFESMKTHAAWSGGVDDSMKHALESFLYGHCHDNVQSVLKDEEKDDVEFLERVTSLQFVTPVHLEIACLEEVENVDELLKEPIETLLSVDSYFSPYEKLQHILNAYHGVSAALSKALNKVGVSSRQLRRLPSADDVLPTFILIILRSKMPRIISNLRMIETFCPPEYLRGEAGYAYTNLYGAIHFLRDLNMDNPATLSISPDDFRLELEECRAAAEARFLAQLASSKEKEEVKEEEVVPAFPIEIPVREIRAARLRGETVDLEWARRWQIEHGAETSSLSSQVNGSRPEFADTLTDSLPPGFSRSYSYMVTRPEDIRVSDLPQLLKEYRMLVHATEQLLGEQTARLAAERKHKFASIRAALLASARSAEIDISPTKKTKKDTREALNASLLE